MIEPFTDDLLELLEVRTRESPDLPDHVLGTVQWLGFVAYPGYYLYATSSTTGAEDHLPVEFIENN